MRATAPSLRGLLLLLLLSCCSSSVLVVRASSFRYTAFYTTNCVATSVASVLTLAAGDGSCVELVSEDPTSSPATVLGLTGAVYGRVWCNDSSVDVPLMMYNDSSCSVLLGARSQPATNVCHRSVRMHCSAFDSPEPAPEWPPAGLAQFKYCDDDSCHQHCAHEALPVNTCIPTTSRAIPLQRSKRILCAANGFLTEYYYLDENCSGQMFQAQHLPEQQCRKRLRASCPAAGTVLPPLPSPLTPFPTTGDGYAIQRSGCNTSTCDDALCRTDARLLASCLNTVDSTGHNAQRVYCVAGGSTAVLVNYLESACAIPKYGSVVEIDPAGSCQTTLGDISCSTAGEWGSPPLFAASFQEWENSSSCDASAIVSSLLIPLDTCAPIDTDSFRATCQTAQPSITFYHGLACSGDAIEVDTASAPGQCSQGFDPGSSIKITCEPLFPNLNQAANTRGSVGAAVALATLATMMLAMQQR